MSTPTMITMTVIRLCQLARRCLHLLALRQSRGRAWLDAGQPPR
jgi:hypothetical protein